MAVVTVDGLRKQYGQVEAVADVSFEVERGEVFALLGPNGAGKTTAIEILEGFRTRDAGRVDVLGFDPADRRRDFRERLGIVLQELAVEPMLSVREVLERNAGFYPSPRRVDEVIELVGLREKSDARVKTLSGGQQRRLDVGLGIVGNPELMFLDEPTTGFDPSARRGAWELVRALTGGGTTVILTTHYLDEAEELADRAAVIARGRIVAIGPPRSLGGPTSGRPPSVSTCRTAPPVPSCGWRHAPAPAATSRSRPTTRWPCSTSSLAGRSSGASRSTGSVSNGSHSRTSTSDSWGHRPQHPRRPREHRRRAAGMTVTPTVKRASAHDLYLVGRQVHYEQLAFWRNPFGAIFTVGFSVVFLLLLAAGVARHASATSATSG